MTYENGTRSLVYPYPDHDAGEVDIWTKNNDYFDTQFIRANLVQGDVIYDIGCNVGNRTWVLADLLGGAVLIDAGEQAVARARENRDLNGLDPARFEVILAAAGAKPGTVKFTDLGGASTLNTVLSVDDHSTVSYREVPMTTIDIEVTKRSTAPAFIKIDAEGHDLEVLKGARATLSSGLTRLVKFENNRNQLLLFQAFFDDIGWNIFALDAQGRITEDVAVVRTAPNIFAVPATQLLELKG